MVLFVWAVVQSRTENDRTHGPDVVGCAPKCDPRLAAFYESKSLGRATADDASASSGGEMVGRAGCGGDRGWEWLSQTRETLDRRGLSILWSSWQDCELPGRRIPGLY